MVTLPRRVAIIGRGRLGGVLARALASLGCEVISGTDTASVDLLILTRRDADVLTLVDALPEVRHHPIVTHCSGAYSSDVLASARGKGWQVAAWHPLMTFTGSEPPEIFKGIIWALEGDAGATAMLDHISVALGGTTARIPPELRPFYHLSGVFSNNLLISLLNEAFGLIEKTGVDAEAGRTALLALVTATLNNLKLMTPVEALTGPVKRGDAATIERHLRLLNFDPELREIYRLLSLRIARDPSLRDEGVVETLEHPWPPVTPRLTVDAVIRRGDEVLLIKRKNPPHGWALPGGFVEVGESVEAAVVREAWEETGLHIRDLRLIGIYSDPARDPRFHTASAAFSAVADGEPVGQDDAAEARFFPLDGLPTDIAFDHRTIIEDAVRSIT